jgi:hypothetical protein
VTAGFCSYVIIEEDSNLSACVAPLYVEHFSSEHHVIATWKARNIPQVLLSGPTKSHC